jgi:iron(III) transport system substrate-binding protein
MLLNMSSWRNFAGDRKARSLKPFLKLLSVAALGVAACSAPPPAEKVVNVYTARHYDSDLALYEQFTRETGIKVNRIEGKADELVARLKAEGTNSPADVFIAADAGALWRAQEAGLFQALKSETIEARIPAALREPDGSWFGFSRRARVVAYDAAKVKPEEVDDYAELAGPRFRGKICVRSSDSIYNLSLVGALIEAWGPQKTEAWAKGIVANMARPPEGGDRDQIRAVYAQHLAERARIPLAREVRHAAEGAEGLVADRGLCVTGENEEQLAMLGGVRGGETGDGIGP